MVLHLRPEEPLTLFSSLVVVQSYGDAAFGLPSAFNKLANRPSALLLEVANSDRPCESMQLHHLIPNEIWNNLEREEKEIPFEALPVDVDNPKNMMDLPSTQAGAMAMGLALHNGSHPAYSASTFPESVSKNLSPPTKQKAQPILKLPLPILRNPWVILKTSCVGG
jgi:hypothetical protein